jgi:hypothetical protein
VAPAVIARRQTAGTRTEGLTDERRSARRQFQGVGSHSIPAHRNRVKQRILALTAAIWHNDHTGRPVLRSQTAYDH